MAQKGKQTFSIQVGGSSGLQDAGGLVDSAFEDTGFSVSMGSMEDTGFSVSFGGEPSVPKTKPSVQRVSTSAGGDEDDIFDRPAHLQSQNEVEIFCDMDAEERHDMGTGTDPSHLRDINVHNPHVLDILEQELMRGKPDL